MRVLWKNGFDSIIFKTIQEPAVVNDRQVKIKVNYAMLGELDYNTAKSKMYKDYIPGYEMTGTIVDLGSDAKRVGFHVGDRVTSIPVLYCGVCENCRRGKYNCCVSMSENEGTLSEYIVRDYTQLFKVPSSFSNIMGCSIWPVAEALEAIEQSRIKINSTVLLLGYGFSSMLLTQLAKKSLTKLLVIVSDSGFGKETALKLGADKFVDCSNLLDAQRLLLQDTNFLGFDSVLVVADNQDLEWRFQGFAKSGGIFCFLAFKRLNYGISIGRKGILSNPITLVSSYLSNNKVPTAIDIIPKLVLDELIDQEFPFKSADVAYAQLMTHPYNKYGIIFD